MITIYSLSIDHKQQPVANRNCFPDTQDGYELEQPRRPETTLKRHRWLSKSLGVTWLGDHLADSELKSTKSLGNLKRNHALLVTHLETIYHKYLTDLRNKSIIRAGILCHPLRTYPNIHLPSTLVSLNETCWASFRCPTPIKLAERVSPSSCTQQCPVIFFHVPFDFAVGHCNLVRKDERSHLVHLQELEPGDGVTATPRCHSYAINEKASMCRASSRNSSKKT